jgi:hypothetical protein
MATARTTGTRVTFFRPFKLNAMDSAHPAGSYVIETDEELLEGLSRPVYRRTATYIVLPGAAGSGIASETVKIEPGELLTALSARLEAAVTKTVAPERTELTLNDLLADRMITDTISSTALPLASLKLQLRGLIARRAGLTA